MQAKLPKLINFTQRLWTRIRRSRIPEFLSKFSKRTYGNHKLLILTVLRQRLSMTYRDFVEFLRVADRLLQALGLDKVPHFSTLQKFSERAKPSWFELMLEQKVSEIVAIDSSGFEPGRASHYYLRRINGFSSRNYVDLSTVVDTKDLRVLGFQINERFTGNKAFLPLLRNLTFSTVVADRAYDSETNHKEVRRLHGARAVIPVRNHSRLGYRTHGFHRKKLLKEFPEQIYHQRAKVETVFSIIKRRFGSALSSRSFASQKFELSARIIAYNIEREIMISLIGIIGFLQSRGGGKSY